MNTPTQPTDQDTRPKVNQRRRMLAKGGLAAPIVLGALMSRPVLGAAPYHCTISGQMSGNVSPRPDASVNCSSLGRSPQYYAANKSTWPAADFLNDSGNPRVFRVTPFTFASASRFADAYEKEKVSGGDTPPIGTIRDANVWDVLAGFVTNATGNQNVNWVLRAKSGFYPDLALGREALAAYMNAVDGTNGYPNFPISGMQVVAMFNSVVSGGVYQVSPTVSWNAAQVISYFQSLHS